MSISLLLEMSADLDPGRIAVSSDGDRTTVAELNGMADRGAALIASTGVRHVVHVGTGGTVLPVLLFAAARAGLALTPLNYRLGERGLCELIERLPSPLVVADREYREALGGVDARIIDTDEFLAATRAADAPSAEAVPVDPERPAVVLFTSGTTSQPKAVELSHSNLTSYVMGTVDFASAEPGDAALICVPPYHIAGVGASLSNLYAGRTMVYQRRFDAADWVRLVRGEQVTSATVVPTMLDRIVSALEHDPTGLPSLRTLAYGGSRVPLPLVRRTMGLLPEVGLVNAYGLTETSSTIAVLTPDDHRSAGSDPALAARLGSVGRAVPGVELQIRAENGTVLGAGEVGELFVRGSQVSGRYTGIGSVLDADGWFPTRDHASVDADGYLYVVGRADDTIIRGGENIAPAEIENVLVDHPDVRDVTVLGLDDEQWGQIIVAVVVPAGPGEPDTEALRTWVRERLRGSRTPDRVVFRAELPTTDTGKVLRRALVDELRSAEPDVTPV
ncbi:class I adenylate-forming enzyme family protein [Rhodococcus sp. NPDC003348]